jgi:hypothetical protein
MPVGEGHVSNRNGFRGRFMFFQRIEELGSASRFVCDYGYYISCAEHNPVSLCYDMLGVASLIAIGVQ